MNNLPRPPAAEGAFCVKDSVLQRHCSRDHYARPIPAGFLGEARDHGIKRVVDRVAIWSSARRVDSPGEVAAGDRARVTEGRNRGGRRQAGSTVELWSRGAERRRTAPVSFPLTLLAAARCARVTNLSLDVVAAKDLFGGEAVMGDAEQSGIGGAVLSAECLRMNVVDLQERSRITSDACLADKGALLTVPREDLATHGARNGARAASVAVRRRSRQRRLRRQRLRRQRVSLYRWVRQHGRRDVTRFGLPRRRRNGRRGRCRCARCLCRHHGCRCCQRRIGSRCRRPRCRRDRRDRRRCTWRQRRRRCGGRDRCG